MDTWLSTVCTIVANDLGTNPRTVRFLLNDYMDVAHEAYNDSIPAACFAQELVEYLR